MAAGEGDHVYRRIIVNRKVAALLKETLHSLIGQEVTSIELGPGVYSIEMCFNSHILLVLVHNLLSSNYEQIYQLLTSSGVIGNISRLASSP